VINWLHSRLHRPEKGWDPIRRAYAEAYAEKEWQRFDAGLVDLLESKIGGFASKRVLDLGAGPAQYSVAFAKRGAAVTWHDISAAYLTIAREQASRADVKLDFSLGYLEDAIKLGQFDLVFCRVAWAYGMSDRGLARVICRLIRPGGAGYIHTLTARADTDHSVRRRLVYLLNNRCWLKIGHPYPPHGRVERLLRHCGAASLETDYAVDGMDRVFWMMPA
jgi:2-polyprenyl-3-methyl-5-hydroxy-6-metoxy-1,4-benzoquinol methylase